ncbi:EamA family transporter RarD [Aliiglaciecola lipolytica]|uniref:Chloramphenicol-sensitive protein RarD n=1 Tax=Aliiglaciecola lipolytica E3 TaxID=1127673 RepID=K6YFV3_9ALTE|nr:EamA family transporter RarD [Aliiglaciecola lipolytica]GAC15513.1 chloramphenicol-sensitive protein RarD [Aliiglaciecola lipolytica E3]
MSDKSIKAGVLFALAAYSMWGFAPLYFKMLMIMPATEILVHRVVWSTLVLVFLVLVFKQNQKVRDALKNPRVLQILLVSGLLLAANWLLFIWAVNNDHLLDASLGYYINPLLNVFLGRIFLGERLRRMQKIAVATALVGVGILVVSYGELPWIALVLASSFGVYGLLRKQVAVDSLPGLLIETLMMLPFAIGYWIFFATHMSDMFTNDVDLNMLLVGAGIITTAPLLCFTAAARRIRYSTLGFFQYIGPSIMFLLAVYLYDEPLHEARLVTFSFVWIALVIFSFDSYRAYRKSLKGIGV